MSYNEQFYKESILKNYGKDNAYACMSKVEQPHEIMEKVQNWMSQGANIFYFSGNPGLGKSYLSAAICNWLVDLKKNFRIFTEKMFLYHLRSGFKSDVDSEFEIMRLCEVPYFIMDDIGSAANLNEWQVEQLFSFLDQRAISRLPTVITSNLHTSDLSKKFTPRFVSRLLDRRNTIIELNGIDKRIQGS